ncbi:MAG: MFS transporter [Rhodobacteraceae bacterium]|uniref:MFS transporter n=1 Tax=Planktotalea sp. TaxID=2029877 RepID=UPI001D973E2C|nr:MFS transporter [Paracoccaceae bacterium]
MSTLSDYLQNNARWLTAGILLTCLSSFGQTFFIALFADDIQSVFELSHGGWGSMYTVGTTASAIVMVWAGRQADVFRVRTLGVLSLLALALACIAMSLNPWLWALPFVIFALRLTGQGMMSHIAAVAMARWFVATRGRALSISALGFSIGQAFLPIAVVALMAFLDWHVIWLLCAGISLIGIPILMMLLSKERTPASMTESSESLGMNGRHWSRNEMLKHPLFWLMVPAILGPSAFSTAFFFHQVHYASVIGISTMQMVSYFPFFTAMIVIAMILTGMLVDRFGTPRLLPYHQLPMVAAFAIFSTHILGLGWGFFFLALTAGAQTTLIAAFWAEFYGTAHLGAIKAIAAAVMVLGSAIGPGLTGILIDFGIGLEAQYAWVAIYFVLASISIWIGVSNARKSLPSTA